MFGLKIGDFLVNQCYDSANLVSNFFCENVFKNRNIGHRKARASVSIDSGIHIQALRLPV
jgi:hypothetical protein